MVVVLVVFNSVGVEFLLVGLLVLNLLFVFTLLIVVQFWFYYCLMFYF